MKSSRERFFHGDVLQLVLKAALRPYSAALWHKVKITNLLGRGIQDFVVTRWFNSYNVNKATELLSQLLSRACFCSSCSLEQKHIGDMLLS